jgi:hypothetical protein
MTHNPGVYHMRIAIRRGTTWQILGRHYETMPDMMTTMNSIQSRYPSVRIAGMGRVTDYRAQKNQCAA